MPFRSTQSRLVPPEVGKPLPKSWVDSVTNNLNTETPSPGGFVDGPNIHGAAPAPYINPVTMRVKNHTNAPQPMFSVLKITTPEETNSDAFPHVLRSQQNAIYGDTPTADCHESVCITTFDMDPETELPCIVAGPSPVKILFKTEESLSFPFAIPIYGDTTKLEASPFGRIKILWHEETQETPTCSQPKVLWGWVDLGVQCDWSFWKLESDLSCCGSAQAKLCDECGTVINPDCPIIRTIYAPPGQTFCSCEDSCASWPAGSVVPALWYEYLCKWVTIPNFTANFQEKEMQVVTGLNVSGGTFTPTTQFQQVITGITIDTNYVTLQGSTPSIVYCTGGAIEFGNDARATGSVTVTGTIGSAQNPIELEVTSQSNLVTIYDASLTSDSNISLTGSLSGSATVSVPLNNVSLGVSGTASGPLTLTNGNVSLNGSCTIPFNNLPNLNVTGSVIKTSQADPVTLGGHSTKTLLSGATINTTTHTLKIPPLTGTLTGSLQTGSGAPTTTANRSNLTATIDLSSIFEMAEAVKEGTLDIVECELTYETINVLKFKQGKTAADLQNIPVTFQGDITVPSSVSCSFDYSQTGATTTTIKGVDTSTNGGLTTTTDSVSIPTTATLHLDKIGVTGTAEWPQTLSQTGLVGRSNVAGTVTVSNNVSLNVSGTATGSSGATATGTATITDTVTVSGPLSISSGVYIRGQFIPDYPMKATGTIPNVTLSTAQDVSLRLSGTIENNQICYADVPDSIAWGDQDHDWIEIETGRIPIPGVDLTGATISGTTATIKYLACADCPEPEEDEE